MQMTDWKDATLDEIVEEICGMASMSFAELDALDWPHANAARNMPRIGPSYGGLTDDLVRVGPVVTHKTRLWSPLDPNDTLGQGNRHQRRATRARRG